MDRDRGPATFVAGAVVTGVGLGGLADGIVLHHVLQWHNLASSRIPPDSRDALATNVFWDGIFHLSATVALVTGFVLLWRGWERRDRATGDLPALVGLLAVGWGTFHVVDHLVFHLLLDLHRIREDAATPALYDWGFFTVGLVLIVLGAVLVRTRGRVGAGRP